MKKLGEALINAANAYPVVTLLLGAVVVSNVAYNICVLVDRHNQYKELSKCNREYYRN